MIVHDFDVIGVAVPKPEAKTPRPVNRNSPLAATPALQGVQSDTLERTDLVQASGRVQNRQPFKRDFDIEAANF